MDTNNQKDITFFAKTNFRNKQVPFGIKRDDRRKHMYIIGKTGMGKTSLMENMIIQDIVNGEGLAFVDPHGDSVEKILEFIPSNRVNDVVYINPADMEFPIAFNILESVDPRYKHLVASGLMGVFTKIWAGVWSPRMEYILNNCILALLESPGNTLLGITRMLIDKKYRKKIVDNVKDPMVRSFWTDEFANWQEKYRQEAVAPIQNKVGQFLSTGLIRNIVGQTKSTIDLRQLMDDKKIVLLNLSKGRIGEDNSALLGAMIITKLQLAALSRVDIPEPERSDFFLYVDEFQNFATDSFATILSEARKYRLNLVIGHQYIGQLVQDKNTKVRDAVFGNVGSIVSFRVGAADAEYLEKEFAPQFTETDLVNIPKHTILLRLMINGVASDPFTAETLPPGTYSRTGNEQKIIRVSRERYANPVAQVEEKIAKWMGQDFHEQVAIIASGSTAPEQVEVTAVNTDSSPTAAETEKEILGAASQPELEAEQPRPEEQPKVTAQQARAERQDPRAERSKRAPQPQSQQPQQHGRTERRNSSNGPNLGRRHSDKRDRKPDRKPQSSPIWDQVSQLNTHKEKESQKKNADLASLIEKTFKVPTTPQTSQASEIMPQEKAQARAQIVEDIPTFGPAIDESHFEPAAKNFEQLAEEVSEKILLKPGQKVKFDG